MTPVYNHNSFETAYLVESYPYGSLRCRIWFWLESHPKKGFRFVSQTENPKNGRMNAPKKSTYARIAGCMFLNEEGHCTWSGITEYSKWEECSAFVKSFPASDLSDLKVWSLMKVRYYQGKLSNPDLSQGDLEEAKAQVEGWASVVQACKIASDLTNILKAG